MLHNLSRYEEIADRVIDKNNRRDSISSDELTLARGMKVVMDSLRSQERLLDPNKE
jgi:hypothetical protein